jgi:hypothetical protein
VLALLVAAWQSYVHLAVEQNLPAFFTVWVAVAAVAVTLTGIETVKRAPALPRVPGRSRASYSRCRVGSRFAARSGGEVDRSSVEYSIHKIRN